MAADGARVGRLQQPWLLPDRPSRGMLAPKHEKLFHQAVEAYAIGNAERALELFEESSARDTGDKAVADELFAG